MTTFYLNGQEVGQPRDWDGYTQKIDRDFERRFIRTSYPGDFTMTTDGYRILRDLFVGDVCDIVPFEVFETCGDTRYQLIKGNIILADCEWNLNACTAKVKVADDTIGARLQNNVRIPVSPQATRSKNGLALPPCVPKLVSVFDPSDPVDDYLATPRSMFDWLEMMQHAVRYMTDSNVTVQSAWYNALPASERIAIVSGYQLRTGDTADNSIRLTYTFNELWLEIAIRHNLWISTRRDNAGNPFLIIEPEASMFPSQMAFSLPNQYDLIQGIDTDRMFSAVTVGDEKGLPNLGDVESLPFLVLQGFSEEKFHFTGVCNVDEILDLKGEWITDTNVIERVVVLDNGNEEYDEDIFIIQYNGVDKATKGDYLNPDDNPYLYNETFLNVNILNRYTLPSDVGSYFNAVDAEFRASKPDSFATGNVPQPPGLFQVSELPLPSAFMNWPDTATPPNNNVLGTWDDFIRYTAPAQGYYVFGWSMPWQSAHTNSFNGTPAQVQLIVQIQHFDSSDNFIAGQRTLSASRVTNGTMPFNGSMGFVMNTGDYIQYEVIVAVTRIGVGSSTVMLQVLPGSSVFTTLVAAGGGVLTNVDPLGARIVTYEFDRIIPISQWQELINDPRLGVGVSHTAGNIKTAHVLQASRDTQKGKTSFTLIASRRQPL